MHVLSGDDDLFINQVATSKNTSLCFTKESFTMSLPKRTFKSWFKQKKRHVSTAKFYKLKHKTLLALFYISQFLFWTLALILALLVFKWKIVLALFIIKFVIQFIVFGFSAKKLGEQDVIILLPFLELFLIMTQLTIFISNLVSKPNHWR